MTAQLRPDQWADRLEVFVTHRGKRALVADSVHGAPRPGLAMMVAYTFESGDRVSMVPPGQIAAVLA